MNKIQSFLKKISYSVGANLLSLIVSLLTTLLIPKFLGNEIEQYGYFQVYWFYVSYIGFFHFGLCDGILLREGGKRYCDLDRSQCAFQFWFLTITEIIVSALIMLGCFFFTANADYHFIGVMVGLNILVYMPRTILQYYLQATGMVKEYASITTLGRAIYGILIIIIFFMAPIDYKYFVWGDWIGKLFAMLLAIWWCRDLVATHPSHWDKGFKEVKKNASVGIKLLFSNIAGMLITGIIRWGIQIKWDIATYGKISFTLSISNLFLVFLNAIAVVLYPILKRTNKDILPQIYNSIRNMLMVILFGCMILYYPVVSILRIWIPQYESSLQFVAILFPLCIYASKMSMLIQTYIQVYRQEKMLLKVNVMGVLLAIFSTGITVFGLQNLTLAMLSVVINQMFRSVYAEIELSHVINIDVKRDIVLEAVLSFTFIIVNWFIGGIKGMILYVVCFAIYLLIKNKDIKYTIDSVMALRILQ